jgi:hypothetical protein
VYSKRGGKGKILRAKMRIYMRYFEQ